MGKLWIYTYANNAKIQIDNILINKKWNNSALNCEPFSSFGRVSFDHRIFKAKIRLNLRRNAGQTTTILQYDWSLLNDRDIIDRYKLKFRNKCSALQVISEIPTLNDEYEKFVIAHLEAAAECTPT